MYKEFWSSRASVGSSISSYSELFYTFIGVEVPRSGFSFGVVIHWFSISSLYRGVSCFYYFYNFTLHFVTRCFLVVDILYLEKVNECFNDIDLKNIFKIFLWEEKKVINFFSNFLYFF